MFKKQIQRHDFLSGGPISQYEIPFQTEPIITNDRQTDIGITFNNANGNTIFTANENGVFHGVEPLTTEERVREIFREEYYNILREDTENNL